LPDPIAGLGQHRASILSQILELGDFCSGSITAIQGRCCGKPNGHCHQSGQSGHGPNFRLTGNVNGKNVSERLASPAELRKAQREVKAFHRFRQLRQQLLEVKEQICRARPVEQTLSPEEKKRSQRSGRKSRPLLRVVFGDRHKSGGRDLEAIKMAVRRLCIRPAPQR